MEKQKYVKPDMKVLELNLGDVITSSNKIELPDDDWEE